MSGAEAVSGFGKASWSGEGAGEGRPGSARHEECVSESESETHTLESNKNNATI